MKTIIAGGRDYQPSADDWETLDEMREKIPITEVVCGMAKGADAFGKEWAELRGVPIKRFPADWLRHGKSAGPIRNNEMAHYADALVVFPGGVGTQHMISAAHKQDLPVFRLEMK